MNAPPQRTSTKDGVVPSDSDDDSDVEFANIDFSGVCFDDDVATSEKIIFERPMDEHDEAAVALEKLALLPESSATPDGGTDGKQGLKATTRMDQSETLGRIKDLMQLLKGGRYADILRGETALRLFGAGKDRDCSSDADKPSTVVGRIRSRIAAHCSSVASCVEAELLGVASLNLFLQLNYTGPNVDDVGVTPAKAERADTLEGINPHEGFKYLRGSGTTKAAQMQRSKLGGDDVDNVPLQQKPESQSENSSRPANNRFHNAILSELAVDGEWPCQVCRAPYFLLFARSILCSLADPCREDWTHSAVMENDGDYGAKGVLGANAAPSVHAPNEFVAIARKLIAAGLWNARAVVAHQRLMKGDEPSITLWREAESAFLGCVTAFCDRLSTSPQYEEQSFAAQVMLEWGLAQHHFDRDGKGKKTFAKALELSGLTVEVTGAEGKRTKYQQKSTAQMLVRARSAAPASSTDVAELKERIEDGESKGNKGQDMQPNMSTSANQLDSIKSQEIQHDEEGILLERIKYNDEKENVHHHLSILDQAILLALCLDVKNSNPMDGLTGEQMGGYLERVMRQHDDWMVYSTALLERAWLECERSHARERAILQIQALADQHTNRLTLTQSTFKSVEEDSAPPQDRLRHLHTIVYPPRWEILRDLAERYAKIGIVSSAAEIFEELELWDEVVECYRHAGKESKAEQVVRARLEENETPRMWAALGDLTNDPSHYERSLKLSNGRFSTAYVALGKYYFDKGELLLASNYFKKALKVKPLNPHVWFRLGTISMQLGEWETALHAFSEVVQQEPEEADAWANVAAVHMHNKNPAEAYPALVESLKQNRNNWRVWISKLYTCIDLKKYDEAIQSCFQLIEFRKRKNASEDIPELEEKCVRAIVGGALLNFDQARDSNDDAATDSARRTLTRVRELLNTISSTMKSDAWIWETCSYFNERVGHSDLVFDDLMKEYRALQNIKGWETDKRQLAKVCRVVTQISELHRKEGSRDSLIKCKYLLKGVVNKVNTAFFDTTIPKEAAELKTILEEVEISIAKS